MEMNDMEMPGNMMDGESHMMPNGEMMPGAQHGMVDEVDDMDDMVDESALPPEEFVAQVTASMNLVDAIEESRLSTIASRVLADYRLDKGSMADWLQKMERGIKLASLVKEDKTYPFKRASNIKYPLVTSAALQFNARAYPAIVPSTDPVKVQTFGGDAQGAKAARAERVSGHMSWQLLNQIDEWEEETDSLLVQLPIVGTMVRKVWYDPVLERPRCRLLDAGAFIINEKAKTLHDAPRCSEEFSLYPSEITERVSSGQFIEFDYDDNGEDKDAAHDFIEQHCRIDLDDDGYGEPYIVTVHVDSQTICRIVADFDPEDVKYKVETQEMEIEVPTVDPMTGMPMMGIMVQPQEVVTGIVAIKRGSYFVVYKFMPSLEGKFHGTGLGLLLGDISDTINTIINMMLDAGHMASLGGGFIGSGFRAKGGNQRFEPGEWKMVADTGGAIRDSMVPMTFPGPDAVLFQMLGTLIEAGKEISSTKDIMTGDNGGKTQTATTTLALIEQGMMVFTAAYKRIFRSLKQEYKLLAKINAETVTAEEYNQFHDEIGPDGQPVQFDPAQDYGASDMDIAPSADPRSVTKMQEMAKADLINQLAQGGMANPQVASRRVMEAASIPNVEELLPPAPDPAKQQMEQQMMQFQQDMMMKSAEADLSQKLVDIDLTLAKIESEKTDAMKTMTEAEAETAKLRLDELSVMMKARKDDIEQFIKTASLGLAGQPGDPRNRQGIQGPVGQPTGPGGAGFLGGPGMV